MPTGRNDPPTLVDDGGLPRRFLSVDTSSDDVLQETEARLNAILNTTVDAIVTIDERGTIEGVNPAAETMFGYTFDELMGTNVKVLMPAPYHDEHDGYLAHYLQTGEKKVIGIGREVEGRRKDGTTFPMELAVSDMRLGGRRFFTGIVRDISGRKQAEAALHARSRQQAVVADLGSRAVRGVPLQALLDDAVSLVAETLDVDMCKALELLPDGKALRLRAGVGWQDGLVGVATVGAELDSQAGYTLVSDAPVIVDDLRTETRFSGPALLRDHGVVSGMSVLIKGTHRPFGVLGAHTARSHTFTRDDAYFLEGVANLLGEAIENRRHQEALVKQASLAQLGEIASMVAHEVKNPLAGIAGALRMLQRRQDPTSTEHELCEQMASRITDLTSLVDELLVFARPRDPNKRPVPLRVLLESVVSTVSQDPQFAEVEVRIAGPDVTVACDHEMVTPLFLNLCLNAAQAMDGTGTISLTVDVDTVGCRAGCCLICVSDSGPGMPDEVRQQIFDPFFTTKAKGTGLGMPLAKRVVELHGGSISVECPPDGGTQVAIQLPVS